MSHLGTTSIIHRHHFADDGKHFLSHIVACNIAQGRTTRLLEKQLARMIVWSGSASKERSVPRIDPTWNKVSPVGLKLTRLRDVTSLIGHITTASLSEPCAVNW